MRELSYYKESYSFDAELTDSTGRKLPIDCEVGLPAIWGDMADIRMAIPHSVMPFGDFNNPCQLSAKITDTAFRLEMNDVWYRKLTSSVHPSRDHGAAPVVLTHISGMQITQEFSHPESEFKIYISTPDLLNKSPHWVCDNRMIEDLSTFRCPRLGLICFQRYWVRAGLEGADGFLSRAGYVLKISLGDSGFKPSELLHLSGPVLKLISVFFRQRIMVLGWESIGAGTRVRYWQYPLEPSKTTYIGVEPKRFLVTVFTLAEKMEAALRAYYNLREQMRQSVDQLSNSLRPAIKLRDSEWFMAMFRDIESIAVRSAPRQGVTDDEKSSTDGLRRLAEAFRESNPAVFDRISGFARKMESGSLPVTQSICWLLQENGVRSSDLWAVNGDKGLVGIRNKLVHSGAHRIHSQGLAVAAFHLSLLNERLVHSMLGLDCSGDELHSGVDEWLQRDYVNSLKKCVYDVIS